MPTFSDQPDQFLKEVETYLAQGPQGDNNQLKDIAVWLTEFEWKHDVATAEKAVQILGTSVGQQHAWQDSFRETGILDHVVQNLDLGTTPTSLARQYLRVIGNCVADNDINRAAVAENLGKLAQCISEQQLASTALAAIFNLCHGGGPAQVEAAKLRLDSLLATDLAKGLVPAESTEYAVEIITWTAEKLEEEMPAQLKDERAAGVLENILQLALVYDADLWQEYIAILLHYLQDTESVTRPNVLEGLVDLMVGFESRLSPEETQEVLWELGAHDEPGKSDSRDSNVILMTQLINSLSAVSASDAFVRKFQLESPVIKKIETRLRSGAVSSSTMCACVMLGNLATSDQVCINMVEDLQLHLPLIHLLSSTKEPALLYAAAAFTRHLSFPERNRSILGETGLIQACCHLLTNADPSVRGEAAAIICKLVSNNFPNIKKVCSEAVPANITPAQLPEVDSPANPTILSHIVTQALVPSAPLPSTSMKNPMIELGRTIIAMLRYVRQSHGEEDINAVARALFETPAIARPVARLVRQRFYADARAEGLLGLGLMAQSPEGAACVVQEMKADEGLLDHIKAFTMEQKGDGQKSDAAAGRVFQNALVLLHGLAKNGDDVLDAPLKADVESLQTALGRLMV